MGKLLKTINFEPKSFNFFVIGTIFFLIFLILVLVETQGIFTGLDVAATVFLQKIVPRSLDLPLSIFSVLGSLEIATVFLLIIAAVIFRRNKIVYFPLALFGVIMVFELIGKLFIFHPGPPKILLRYDLPFATPEYVTTSYSFPSGHVGRSAFLFAVLSVLVVKKIQKKYTRVLLLSLLTAFLIVMIVSRIYLGEHWTSDVLGGLFLGAAMGTLAMVYY